MKFVISGKEQCMGKPEKKFFMQRGQLYWKSYDSLFICGLIFLLLLPIKGCSNDSKSEDTSTNSDDSDDSETDGPAASFLIIHLEPYNKNLETTTKTHPEIFWPDIIDLVELANSYGIALNLQFSPPWAEYILADATRTSTVREWESNGHEIASHHHGPNFETWDGYTNDSSFLSHEDYLGNMNAYWEVVRPLSVTGTFLTMTTGGGVYGGAQDEEMDWISDVPFSTNGRESTEILSVPTKDTFDEAGAFGGPYEINKLTMMHTALDENAETDLSTIEAALESVKTESKIVGLVTHDYEYIPDGEKQNKDKFIQLFELYKKNNLLPRRIIDIMEDWNVKVPDVNTSTDEDQDGVSISEGDCNDTDPEIFPSAEDWKFDGIDQDCSGSDDVTPGKPGEEIVTYIQSESSERIAVRLTLPSSPRFSKGAPVVLEVSTFFTDTPGFYSSLSVTDIGAIQVNYLWPGKSDSEVGISSDGTFDYGGSSDLLALKNVARFSLGLEPTLGGYFIDEVMDMTPLTENMGLYAFSHPGLAAVNMLALYGEELTGLVWLVGRENPTLDTLSAVELGFFSNDIPYYNPYYQYSSSFSTTAVSLDYSKVGWVIDELDYPEGRPFFKVEEGDDFVLGHQIPTMFGKRFYSTSLLTALRDNGSLTDETWPTDLATPEEASEIWPFRTVVNHYSQLKTKVKDLKVMLVFCEIDHVQPSHDKPHVHQAYDGFHVGAELPFVRLNPDRSYVTSIDEDFTVQFPDNDANTSPDWETKAEEWAYPNLSGTHILVPMAAVAEMVDRAQSSEWTVNLDQVLMPE